MAKSRKVLKRIAEIPNWFNLSKYEGSQFLKTEGWWLELHRRWSLNYYLDEFKHDVKPIGDDLVSILERPVDYVSGLVEPDTREHFAKMLYNPVEGAKSNHESIARMKEDGPTVQFLTIESAFSTVDSIRKSCEGLEYKYAHQREMERSSFKKSNLDDQKLMHTPYDKICMAIYSDTDNRVHAVCDFTAPNEVLIEDFKDWLNRARKELKLDGPKWQFKKKDFQKWSYYQVLPYLDLCLWSRLEKVTITHNLMGEIIFPNEIGVDTTERVRQTVKPLANYLNTSEIVFGLARQRKAELLKNEKETD